MLHRARVSALFGLARDICKSMFCSCLKRYQMTLSRMSELCQSIPLASMLGPSLLTHSWYAFYICRQPVGTSYPASGHSAHRAAHLLAHNSQPQRLVWSYCFQGRYAHLTQSISSSSSCTGLAPGLLLRRLSAFLPPLAVPELLLGGGRTNAKSTPIVCSSSCWPLACLIASFASSRVGYSMSA